MPISPTRLVLARKLRGLTLAELGRMTDLSPQTINRYENGRQEPGSDSLRHLADALLLPVAFFEQDEVEMIPIEAVSFRALTKTPAFRRDAAIAAGEIASEIADWIAARFRLPEPEVPSLVVPEHAGLSEVENLAYRVRAQWDLGSKPVPNMVHLLESRGIRVFSLVQEVRDVDAFSFYRNNVPFVFLDTGKTAERQRFDAAHELGHLVMHQGSEKVEGREAERQADRFAASFLMPREDVFAYNLHNASIARILQMSRRWQVSAMALTHRLHELDLLTEWGYRSVCMELSKRGYRRSEPDSSLQPESSLVLAKVLGYLRSSNLGVRTIVNDLNLTNEEFNRHVFGLATTIRSGSRNVTNIGTKRDHLRIVGGSDSGPEVRDGRRAERLRNFGPK